MGGGRLSSHCPTPTKLSFHVVCTQSEKAKLVCDSTFCNQQRRATKLLLTTRLSHRSHGAQSVGDEASKATLDNEFETTNVDDVIKIILEKGDIQETEVRAMISVPFCPEER